MPVLRFCRDGLSQVRRQHTDNLPGAVRSSHGTLGRGRSSANPLDRQELVGRNITAARTDRGLSQGALAVAMGVHPDCIRAIELGDMNVGLRAMERFCMASDADVQTLLACPEPSPRRRTAVLSAQGD